MPRVRHVLAVVCVLPAFLACERTSTMPEAFNSNLARESARDAREEDLAALPIAEDPGADSGTLLADQTKLNRPLATSLLNAPAAEATPVAEATPAAEATPETSGEEPSPTPTPEGL